MNKLITALGATLLIAGCGDQEQTELVGTLERDRIELKVESSEPIVDIHVADGQPVAAGELIISQNPARAEARLAQQTAARDQAAARLAELVRGPRPELIEEARATLASADVLSRNAGLELERAREVFDKGLSSQQRLDRAQTDYDDSLARAAAARENLERLTNGTTAEELDQAEAAVAVAEAAVSQARIDLDRTRVRASIDGRIDKVLYRIGDRPPPGTTIAVLLDSSRIFARVYVPESLRAGFQPGEKVRVRVDGAGRELEGRVRWVSADASFTPYFALTEHDRSRLSYLAEVDVPDAQGLPVGVPLVVELPGGRLDD